MYTDYKWWYVKRDDDGFITEATVRFHEGEYQTKIIEGEEKQVYVRTKKLNVEKGELSHLKKTDGKISYAKEIDGTGNIAYTQKEFGKIKTDDELRAFCNKEIAKDKGREVIKEQKI